MNFIPAAYQLFIVATAVALLLLTGIKVQNRRGWWLDVQTFFFVLIIIYVGSIYVELSPVSYILLFLFAVLHIIGSQYSYIKIPFGYTLGKFFRTNRNIFDRLVHFSFGLLFTYPFYEVFSYNFGLQGLPVYYLPFSQILALSAVFEIFEWLRASSLDPELAEYFIGMQGDIWDSSKDIASAGAGSLITTSIIFLANVLF